MDMPLLRGTNVPLYGLYYTLDCSRSMAEVTSSRIRGGCSCFFVVETQGRIETRYNRENKQLHLLPLHLNTFDCYLTDEDYHMSTCCPKSRVLQVVCRR